MAKKHFTQTRAARCEIQLFDKSNERNDGVYIPTCEFNQLTMESRNHNDGVRLSGKENHRRLAIEK